jgi:hypothetical protein
MGDASPGRNFGVTLLALVFAAGTAAAQPNAAPAAQPTAGGAVQPNAAAASSPDDGSTKRLGRKYPVAAPRTVAPREPPQVYVAIVSPADSSVHQKTGRFRRGRAGDAGGQGAGVPTANGMMR